MSFIKNTIEFIRSPSHSRTFGLLIVLILLAAIPLTVIISQQQQQLRQRASGTEVCSDINSLLACEPDFQTNPCSSLGQRCIDRNNIVFDSASDNTVVFECKEE